MLFLHVPPSHTPSQPGCEAARIVMLQQGDHVTLTPARHWEGALRTPGSFICALQIEAFLTHSSPLFLQFHITSTSTWHLLWILLKLASSHTHETHSKWPLLQLCHIKKQSYLKGTRDEALQLYLSSLHLQKQVSCFRYHQILDEGANMLHKTITSAVLDPLT